MKIIVQLYDPDGCGCGSFTENINSLVDLIEYLDYISDNGYYSFEIGVDDQ